MLILLLLAALHFGRTAGGPYACNECFCFQPLEEGTYEHPCHNYNAGQEQYYYNNAACVPMEKDDNCMPKIYPSKAACESACARFFALVEDWATMPMVD